MPRTARIAIVDLPHHITQRGNNRHDVFFVDDNRHTYLSILKEQSEKYGLEILGWCQWSSASAHLSGKDQTGLLNISYWNRISSQMDWSEALQERVEEDVIDRIRLNTHTGRPLASDSFISKLEKVLNKRIRPLPVGRPRKKNNENNR